MRRTIRLVALSFIYILLIISIASCGIARRGFERALRNNQKRTESITTNNNQITRQPINNSSEETDSESGLTEIITGPESETVNTPTKSETTIPVSTESTTQTGSASMTTKPEEHITETEPTATEPIVTEPTVPSESDSQNTSENDLFSMEDILENGPAIDRLEEFDPNFIEAALEYFTQIAGGNEFDTSAEYIMRRRNVDHPILIQMLGSPTTEDQAVMDKMLPVVSKLTGLQFEYTDNSDDTNMRVYISPLEDFYDIFGDGYVEGNWGFVYYWWDYDNVLIDATIAVSNDRPNRREMNHLIQEEFIQGLGLPNDSYWYSDSLFQQDWTDTQEPAPIDWLLLEFVYRPELYAGISVAEAEQILRGIYLN